MTKQLIPPGLFSHEELFVGAIFLQKRCNNMSFCHDIDCKTRCKMIEDVRARKLPLVIHTTKGKDSVANHFNQVPICFLM